MHVALSVHTRAHVFAVIVVGVIVVFVQGLQDCVFKVKSRFLKSIRKFNQFVNENENGAG